MAKSKKAGRAKKAPKAKKKAARAKKAPKAKKKAARAKKAPKAKKKVSRAKKKVTKTKKKAAKAKKKVSRVKRKVAKVEKAPKATEAPESKDMNVVTEIKRRYGSVIDLDASPMTIIEIIYNFRYLLDEVAGPDGTGGGPPGSNPADIGTAAVLNLLLELKRDLDALREKIG